MSFRECSAKVWKVEEDFGLDNGQHCIMELEKEMATHSSILAWKIPWTDDPGGLRTVHGVAKSWTRLSD